MLRRSRLWLVCLLAFSAIGWSPDVEARNIRFSHLSVEDGLSQSVVHAILQDRDGMMWFGTQEGLNRYDGYEFTVFTRDRNLPGSLSHDLVRSLLEDSRGRLWVGTDGGGLNLYDPVSETFEHFRHDPEDPTSLSNDRVLVIFEDPDTNLWIGTDGGGLSRLDEDARGFVHYESVPGDVSSLAVDEAGLLWVGTDGGGLSRVHRKTGRAKRFVHDPADSNSLSDDRVRTLFADRNGSIWVGTYEGGLDRLDPLTERFTHFQTDEDRSTSLSANRVRVLLEDSLGTLWVGTDGGLNEHLGDGDMFRRYQNDPSDPKTLRDDRVASIYQDRGGVLWVGTYGGLHKWNVETGSFAYYGPTTMLPSGRPVISNAVVMALAKSDDEAIWIGTYGGGLSRWRPDSGTVDEYRADDTTPGALRDDRVMSLLVDRRRRLWVGTFEGGLYVKGRGQEAFRAFRHDPDDPSSLSSDGVTTLLEDDRGRLWVGTYRGGLNRYDSATGQFVRYTSDERDPQSLRSNRVVALTQDADGTLWVGTDGGGLSRWDEKTGGFEHFVHDPLDRGSLSSDHVWAVHEDQEGSLWVGTQGQGLNRWSAEDRTQGVVRFTHFDKAAGLASNVINAVLTDRAGDLWVSTNRGISRLDASTGRIRNYDPSHGLQSYEFNFGAALQLTDGSMLFGGINGFNHFDPDVVRDNDHEPPVVITGISRLNQRMQFDRPLSQVERVNLSHRDAVFSVDFAALDFTSPEKNQYRYRLEGFEENWTEAGTLRRATYTNLPAGDYTLRVQAANNAGVWNRDGASLDLRVAPAPWRTNWAYILYGLVFGAIVIRMHRRHRREVRRSQELETTNENLEREIGERKRAEEKIRNLSVVVEQSPASVLIADRDGFIEYVNPKFEEITGYDRGAVTGERLETLSSGYASPDIYRSMWSTVKAGDDWRGEIHSRKRSGELFWEYASVSPIVDGAGNITHILAVNEDITVRKEYEQKLLRQAQYDHLTDLPNRALAVDRLSGALARDRRQKKKLALLAIGLDNFKAINDTLGHAAGDELLQQTAGRLSASIRDGDTLARLGGDEFLMIFTDLDTVQQAELAVGRALECFEDPFSIEGRDIFLTASIGVTVSPEDGNQAMVLLRNADAAMHKAKASGRAAYQFFTPTMNEKAQDRLRIETELRGALDRDELELHFQPIFSSETLEVESAEALLRWNSPTLGSVSPAHFIPIAEETGLIRAIGEWVLRQASREAVVWDSILGRPVRVAVNISSRQLSGVGLLSVVESAISDSGLPPSCLELEVTEGWLMEDVEDAAMKLQALSDLGTEIAVDDFGTGYSSLSYLQRFSFDRLKIDRSFVQGLGEGGSDALVTAILAMSKSLGLSVVAEGVETEPQLDFLRDHGCPLIQGFYLGRPMPRAAFREFLAGIRGAARDAETLRPTERTPANVH